MKKKKLTHSIEDYLETLFLLSEEGLNIRTTDLSRRMHVRKSSIAAAVKKLNELGYVNHERYGSIELTKTGVERGKEVYRKHQVLKSFFLDVLKLPEEIAEKDACNIEHYISDQTVKAIIELAENLNREKK